jgi:hypothetical protein
MAPGNSGAISTKALRILKSERNPKLIDAYSGREYYRGAYVGTLKRPRIEPA